MRTSFRFALSAAVVAIWAVGHATDDFSIGINHLSAFQDASNIFGGADYKVDFNRTASAADPLYIDSVDLGGDAAGLTAATTSMNYHDYLSNTNSTYNFGDPISGDQSWTFDQVASLTGATTDSLGEHDFTIDFMGHYGSNTDSVLAALNCVLFVAPKLDITVTGSASPPTISAGQQSTMNMTVTDHMATPFVSTTWFVSGMAMGSSQLNFNGFDYGPDGTGWFNKTINTGDSLTLGHSFWGADATTPLGTYTGLNGVVGGLFNGDYWFVGMNPNAPIVVTAATVPEPVSTSIGLACLLLAVRRRRRALGKRS